MTFRFLIVLCVVVALANVASQASAVAPLRTAIYDPFAFEGPEAPLAFARTKAAGASAARLSLAWSSVVPGGEERPRELNAADPADPLYRWENLDKQVRLATSGGLDPVLVISAPPDWAQQRISGSSGNRPDVGELRQFATAVARRYSGSFAGLPRVRYWQVWNEPNLKPFLAPQSENGRSTSPGLYRELVNAMADAVKQVDPSNLVVAGGLAPFSLDTTRTDFVTPPLRFMRELLCVRGRTHPRATCADRTRFDIWSTHPYTTGGPTQSAFGADDVSLGDLPEMRRVLQAADRGNRIVAPRPVSFWVTEFSWDTSPPDPGGVPPQLHARWVSEAMYRMWRSGVSLVTWFLLTDRPHVSGGQFELEFQSGLYFRRAAQLQDATPKPALAAFRFPFVALPERNRVHVWGRAPGGRATTVIIERQIGGRWARAMTSRTDSAGIFQRRLQRRPATAYRARVAGTGGAQSIAFSLTRPAVQRYNPFGGRRPR